MKKYDDASWHYEGDFPADLPRSAAATHIGMFLSWALLKGLGSSDIHSNADVERLILRIDTPGKYMMEQCDGKLTSEDLSDRGNLFTNKYYDLQKCLYLNDYSAAFGNNVDSVYHVSDNWSNYEIICRLIDERYKSL